MTTPTPEQEAAFQRLVELKANYYEEVRASGDVPWFEDPAKLSKLGIDTTDPMEARRELFMRRYGVNRG